jgi:hypothetical protein
VRRRATFSADARGRGISRSGSAALWALSIAAACSGGGAANTDGGFLPALDAMLVDAHADGILDAGIPDAGIPDGSENSEPDAGGMADGGAIDGPNVQIPSPVSSRGSGTAPPSPCACRGPARR